ncbi:MAG: glycosyltransferase WbuB [Acidimicrobiaceae bacterium]|nr:glycosyltransferase WbuB [Acidimicrobiaceae bacterium]
MSMRLLVISPHFEPDTAPTGIIVTSLVEQWLEQGHQIEVITSLPWYEKHEVENQWKGRLFRKEEKGLLTVTRLHPFPQDKNKLLRRLVGFLAFSFLALIASVSKKGPFDAVIVISPPLTLGTVGKAAAVRHRCKLLLNLQDIFPDIAITLGKIKSRSSIKVLEKYEKLTYSGTDSITVLSKDLEKNVNKKIESIKNPPQITVIPNFLISSSIKPQDRLTEYRKEHHLGEKFVVMYAGNLGNSQSFELITDAAKKHEDRDDIVYVINGGGVMSSSLKQQANNLRNLVVIGYQPIERLPEVLATADLHLVPLRTGLGGMSVPSKIYSVFAAGRPVIASVDPGTEIERIVVESEGGIVVPPDDFESFTSAVEKLIEDSEMLEEMGNKARFWLENCYSSKTVADSYLDLIRQLNP